MDDINVDLNFVTTECGHCFHASCLMRNVAHNGFGCPYCRTVMAETPKSEEEEEEDWNDEDSVYDDYTLRGFRLFFNNVYGLEQEEIDIIDENDENYQDEEDEIEPIVKPSISLIVNKLSEKGITMEHLVKILLFKDHEEYTENEEEYNQLDNDVFGKIRIIINNYNPTQEPSVLPIETKEEEKQVVEVEVFHPILEADTNAQPKINNINNRRRPLPVVSI